MGQRISNNSVFKAASISWEEFVQLIKEINDRCMKIDNRGSHICFAVKKGTDETFLWKHTIRICCLKKTNIEHDEKKKMVVLKIFSLSQFLRICNSLIPLIDTAEAPDPVKIIAENENIMSASMFEDSCTDQGECIVCLEREPNVVLPCTHAYCDICLNNWRKSGSSICPLCRYSLNSREDDSWVVPDIPEKSSVKSYFWSLVEPEPSCSNNR